MSREIFNIFEKVAEEIADFDNKGVYIVGKPSSENEKAEKGGERGGYFHSQKQLLEAIDLAGASKFKKGIWDEEGQRKTYINIVNFYRDVMKMKIMITVKNYLMKPRGKHFTWIVWLFDQMFKLWADEESYDDQISEFAHDLSTYGSTVSKKIEKCPERVPLRSIRVTQTAKSLYSAATSGGYVLIENEMHYNQMEKYPDWDIESLNPTKSYGVMERYALLPEGLVKRYSKMEPEEIEKYRMKKGERMVLAMAFLILEGADDSRGISSRKVLFIEKLDEESWPLEECHVEKRDGRWIGIGEVEKQLENQISRNLDANLRRRGILWATKKIFRSNKEDVNKNLVMEVADGEVIYVGMNGTLDQVNTQSQHSAEITADENAIKENSQQISFAFEVATGEALPSNTPFRLGVILQQSVAQHFTLVRRTFSNFLKRAFFEQVIPSFLEEYEDEHEAIVGLVGPQMENFREEIIVFHTNMRIWDAMIEGNPKDAAVVRQQVEEELARNQYAFIDVPEKYYEEAELVMELNLVDDISADIADLTTLYQAMVGKGDPRADEVLKDIFALRGKALPAIIGKPLAPTPSPVQNVAPAPVSSPTAPPTSSV